MKVKWIRMARWDVFSLALEKAADDIISQQPFRSLAIVISPVYPNPEGEVPYGVWSNVDLICRHASSCGLGLRFQPLTF